MVLSAAENILADIAGGAGLCDRLVRGSWRPGRIRREYKCRSCGADRITGDHDAFDQLMRITLDQLAILERARLTLVGIAAEIARALIVLGEKSPFDPGRKSCTAAPP